MGLTYQWSRAELSSDPAKGRVTGDADPSVTQAGVLTKLAKADEEIKADIEALAAVWDAHDHDPANPTGAGGQPIGTGGVRAIATGAIEEALLAANAVTGAKTQASAVDSRVVADATLERSHIGTPVTSGPNTFSGEWTITHGLGYVPLFSVESPDRAGQLLGARGTTTAIVIVASVSTADVIVRYYGG
jgi:hypothetical protein